MIVETVDEPALTGKTYLFFIKKLRSILVWYEYISLCQGLNHKLRPTSPISTSISISTPTVGVMAKANLIITSKSKRNPGEGHTFIKNLKVLKFNLKLKDYNRAMTNSQK